AAGDYRQTTALPSRGDEIGRLSRAFDAMVDRLRDAFTAVRASEERHRRLFESIPIPCVVFDRDTLGILAVNEAAIVRYGYSHEEFSAMTMADLRPADAPLLRETVAALSNGKGSSAQRTWRHTTKDGTLIDVNMSGHPVEFAGQQAVVVVI